MLVNIVAALALPLLASGSQLRFPSPGRNENPSRVLSASSGARLADVKAQDDFVVLEHPHFEGHSIKIKETTGWCDPDVASYSGYLDVGYGKEMYFTFFESRSDPANDDVIMWINGGPGCSSAIGAYMELGPCSVVEGEGKNNLTTMPNPSSWNSRASVFFLDEPINVGFSYSKNGQTVGTTEAAALDVQAFISIFFETFSEFKGRKLHLAGESYGGRYLPIFAAAVYDGNKALVAAGGTAINLKSVMIGNGITDSFSMLRGYYEHTCTSASGLPPLVSVGACQAMALALPRCEAMVKADCLDRMDVLGCEAAMGFCQQHIDAPFWSANLNPYDVSKSCTREELSNSLCYPVTKKIGRYLDQPHVRALLGVSNRVPKTFQSCSPTVGAAFGANHDSFAHTWLTVAALLEHGVDVLIYVGKLDWICNSSGNYIWTNALQWTGGEEFSKQKLRDWHVDGKVAGQTRSHKGLTFMTIDGAGHMVPYDKPVESLQMVERWLSKKEM